MMHRIFIVFMCYAASLFLTHLWICSFGWCHSIHVCLNA